MTNYSILSTKLLDPSLKEMLAGKGISCMEQEFIAIHPIRTPQKQAEVLRWIEQPTDTAVVFTSRHAVAGVEFYLHHCDTWYIPQQWNIYCLEGATLRAVHDQFETQQIRRTAPDAAALAQQIIQEGKFKEVIFFCGNQRRNELPDLLKANGIYVQEVIVYETTETTHINTDVMDAILFFSPSAVKSFFGANTLSPQTTCFAIGPTTASTVKQFTGNRIITSERPDQETMVASLWLYLQNIDQYK